MSNCQTNPSLKVTTHKQFILCFRMEADQIPRLECELELPQVAPLRLHPQDHGSLSAHVHTQRLWSPEPELVNRDKLELVRTHTG